MLFPVLESIKRRSENVRHLLSELEVYLEEILQRPPYKPENFYPSPSHDIKPELVAGRLNIGVREALALLQMCVETGIVRQRMDIFCPKTDIFLESFYKQLPHQISCPHHMGGKTHNIADCLIEFAFEFTDDVIANRFATVV